MTIEATMNSLATNTHVEGGPYPEKMLQQLVWFAEAIEQAIQGGWNTNLLEDDWHVHAGTLGTAEFCFPRPAENRVTHLELFSIIYDHTFVRAIWGDAGLPNLAAMVLTTDPLLYLEEHRREGIA